MNNKILALVLIFLNLVCLQIVCGDDLTTLDGKVFTNITEVVKYPKMVVFTFNGERKPMADTNLPDAFRVKYGIMVVTDAPGVTPETPEKSKAANGLSAVDAVLLQNKDTDLMECDDVGSFTNNAGSTWQICVHGSRVSLTAYGKVSDTGTADTRRIEFQIGQEAMIGQVFQKYLEWDALAQSNHAVQFEKIITNYKDLTAIYDEVQTFTFHWDNETSSIWDSSQGGIFYKDDVIHFQQILKLLPGLKEKLAGEIQKKDSQKDMFK